MELTKTLAAQKLDWYDVSESSRTYVYADGQEFIFHNVTRVCVRPSGNHRLEMGNGDKAIVAPGWRVIKFTGCDKWNF